MHVYMDAHPIPSDPERAAIPANATTVWAHVSGTAHAFTNVPQGVHTFTVQLANNITPAHSLISDSITVTCVSATPTPAPAPHGGGGR